MDDNWTARRTGLNQDLTAAVAADPMAALPLVSGLLADLTEHQRAAVRAAAPHHSWAEIGAALGVSRQAAQQRFAKEWATELKGEIKAEIRARKAAEKVGRPAEAADAQARMDSVITEFKDVRKANKRAQKH